jgi:hypothetical protein
MPRTRTSRSRRRGRLDGSGKSRSGAGENPAPLKDFVEKRGILWYYKNNTDATQRGDEFLMSKNLTRYDLLVSCPGDIKEELTIIGEVVERFNDDYSDALNISVRIRHWSKSAYAESGGKPQALLNEQFIKNCDAAVAIFWTRFGTPTDDYGSGTEEEIALLTEAGKQVFVYFSEVPVPPGTYDNEQYDKIKEFKNRYSDKGIYFSYGNHEAFRKLFTAHLVKYFMSLEAIREVQNEKKPQILLKSINANGQLEDAALIMSFKSDITITSVSEMFKVIDCLYEKIKGYPVMPKISPTKKSNPESPLSASLQGLVDLSSTFYEDVVIDDDKKGIIRDYAQIREISMPNDFFNLGNLCRNKFDGIGTLGYSQGSLKGTSEEIEKRKDILGLYKKIMEALNWRIYEDTYSVLKGIKLCLENVGTTYDEDIEILLKFPKDMILFPENIPFAKDFNIRDTEYSFDDIFGILKTSRYLDYYSSVKQKPPTYTPPATQISGFPFYGSRKSDEDEFYDAMEEVFDYDFFCEDEYDIVKLQFDYIKHNTAVAFPTMLFVTDKISDVEYQITSKHCDTPINGVFKMNKTILT